MSRTRLAGHHAILLAMLFRDIEEISAGPWQPKGAIEFVPSIFRKPVANFPRCVFNICERIEIQDEKSTLRKTLRPARQVFRLGLKRGSNGIPQRQLNVMHASLRKDRPPRSLVTWHQSKHPPVQHRGQISLNVRDDASPHIGCPLLVCQIFAPAGERLG